MPTAIPWPAASGSVEVLQEVSRGEARAPCVQGPVSSLRLRDRRMSQPKARGGGGELQEGPRAGLQEQSQPGPEAAEGPRDPRMTRA